MSHLVNGKFANHNTRWTDAERAVIAESIGKMSHADIAALLPGRTVEAIRQRATMLGIRRSGARLLRPLRAAAQASVFCVDQHGSSPRDHESNTMPPLDVPFMARKWNIAQKGVEGTR